MIFTITTIVGLVVFLLLGAVILNNMRNKSSDTFSIALLIIDSVLIIMIVFPKITYKFITDFGFWRPEIAFLSIVSTTALLFATKSFFKQKEFEKEITNLTREIALKNEK